MGLNWYFWDTMNTKHAWFRENCSPLWQWERQQPTVASPQISFPPPHHFRIFTSPKPVGFCVYLVCISHLFERGNVIIVQFEMIQMSTENIEKIHFLKYFNIKIWHIKQVQQPRCPFPISDNPAAVEPDFWLTLKCQLAFFLNNQNLNNQQHCRLSCNYCYLQVGSC